MVNGGGFAVDFCTLLPPSPRTASVVCRNYATHNDVLPTACDSFSALGDYDMETDAASRTWTTTAPGFWLLKKSLP
jgi:hypothetical protein